jgi:hypothetical protein
MASVTRSKQIKSLTPSRVSSPCCKQAASRRTRARAPRETPTVVGGRSRGPVHGARGGRARRRRRAGAIPSRPWLRCVRTEARPSLQRLPQTHAGQPYPPSPSPQPSRPWQPSSMRLECHLRTSAQRHALPLYFNKCASHVPSECNFSFSAFAIITQSVSRYG